MQAIFIVLPLAAMIGACVWAVFAFLPVLRRKNRKAGDGATLARAKLVQGVVALALAAAMLVVLVLVPASIHQVNTGEIAVVKVWGEARDTKQAGIHYGFWISDEYVIYDLKTQEIQTGINTYSLDAQTMDCALTVQYKIQSDKVIEINEKYGSLQTLGERITAVSIEQAKVVLSGDSAMDIIKNRDSLGTRFTEALSPKLAPYFVDVTLCVVTNIQFSEAFEKVVEDKMIAEQEKLKAEYEKEKAIIQAEQELEVAKLNAQSKLAEAEGEAKALKEIARAEAQAIKLKSIEIARMMGFDIIEKEIVEDGEAALSYDIDFTGKDEKTIALISDYLKYITYLETWDGKLPTVVTDSGANIMIPVPGTETGGGTSEAGGEQTPQP